LKRSADLSEHKILAGLPAALRAASVKALLESDFIRASLERDPRLATQLLRRAARRLAGPIPLPALVKRAAKSGAEPGESDFMRQLRIWRNAELARIAWRDLTGWATLQETLHDLSSAADKAIQSAYVYARARLVQQYGRPMSAGGAEQPLVIVAMGKLGGGELNFSSDIDPVFLYPEPGETDGRSSLSNEEFFTRLGQFVIRLLNESTEQGLVYRVDMRLRPFGNSGPLVTSFDGLEDYLLSHGRDWERYAWIKARPVTGVEQYPRLYQQVVRPFVYRRYLDFGVFASLREMKGLIEREVARRELQDNIKLGPGGIREIEFIVQSFQLVRGGNDKRLQQVSLQKVLPLLAGSKLLPAAVVASLDASYEFLRRLENRLQMLADQQTHELPAAAPDRTRLATAMGCRNWSQLKSALAGHRRSVAQHFAALVFGDSEKNNQPDVLAGWSDETRDLRSLTSQMTRMKLRDGAALAVLLQEFSNGALIRRLDEAGRQRLVALVPKLMGDLRAETEPAVVLGRLVRILESIGTRTSYFALLQENPRARQRLVQLVAQGEFLAEQLASFPLLLDELIDESLFELPPERGVLQADLAQRLAQVESGDDERQLDQLRIFQRIAMFRVAVADVTGRIRIMQVSDRLTEIAELIIEEAMMLVRGQLQREFGIPFCGVGRKRREVRICAVGYGKLGGREMSYASDLDLVFLHDSEGGQQQTRGARVVDNQVYFVRYVQRLVHLLTALTAAGKLYELDMRLRPSGKGGMLITQLEAFASYQREEAWTWEHQALLHARAVAGNQLLREQFEQCRLRLLSANVRRDTLQSEVSQMRQRMRDQLSRAAGDEFDLKQDSGGIADIEFMAQYWALKWADKYPPVVMFADTIRQLESIASANLVPQLTIDVLTSAYRSYRQRLHHRALDGAGAVLPAKEFMSERGAVAAIWNQYMSPVPLA
jgi:glutamate-ammonia-ligase adenylyltransferase